MTGSYWQLDAAWSDRWAKAEIPRQVDFAIVGAGLAGLATAIRLREQNPAAEILVLDAERVGYGASGRNAGFLSPLAAPVWLLGAARSPEQAWGAARVNHDMHEVASWLATHVPDCELAPVKLSLQAHGRVSDSALREFARTVESVGLSHQLVESRVRPGHLSLEMEAYTVHPYKLVRGLAELAYAQRVHIRERARVQRVVALRAGGARVELQNGTELEAGKVVLCTNAYTSTVDVGERVSAIAVRSFMVATAPVSGRVVHDGGFTVEVNTTQAYHRMYGGRIIYGGIDKLRASSADDFAVPPRESQRLEEAMRHSFPGASLAIEHTWSGQFHATATGLPIIRMAAENHAIVFNVGYGGTGATLALICARLAAAVASHGRFTNVDDTRLLGLMHETRISIRDSVRTIARIARAVAMPWLRT